MLTLYAQHSITPLPLYAYLQRLVLLIIVTLYFTACTEPVTEEVRNFAAVMDDFARTMLDTVEVVPGVAIVVVRGDEVVYLQGFGYADFESKIPATPDTDFYIASSTKSFTALAAALLHHEGRFDLDASLASQFADLTLPGSIAPDRVTSRHLLSHSHGLSNDAIVYRTAFTGDHTPQQLRKLVEMTSPDERAPLGTFRYSNLGYNIISIMLDQQTGMPWQDLLDTEIFEPLGMTRTTAYASEPLNEGWPVAQPYAGLGDSGVERIYLEKQDNTMQAAGGMYTTARDAGRWLIAQLNEGRVDGRQIFPPEVISTVHKPFATTDAAYGPYGRTGYGLGWYSGPYKGNNVVHHFGGFGGAHSHISFMPDHDLGVAVFVNESGIGSRAAVLLASLAYDWWTGDPDALKNAEDERKGIVSQMEEARSRIAQDLANRANRTWTLSRPFEAYAGAYENDEYGTFSIKVKDGKPEVTIGNMHAIATPYTSPESMRVELIPEQGEVIEFEMTESNQPALLVYHGVRFKRE